MSSFAPTVLRRTTKTSVLISVGHGDSHELRREGNETP